MTNRHLGELLLHNLRHNLAPQPARRKNIGLVQAPHGQGRVVLQGQVRGEAGDAFDLGARVRLRVHCETGSVVFLAVAEVDTSRQLADDVEVDAAADFFFEWGALDERGSGEVAWAEVAECAHLLAELEDALFRADGAGAPFLFLVGR